MGAPRILVVGGDARRREGVASVLASAGLEDCELAETVRLDARDSVPDLILVCGEDPAPVCAEAREVPLLAGVPLLAVVPALPEPAGRALAAGADDVVHLPLDPAIVGARIRALHRSGQASRSARSYEGLHEALSAIYELLAAGGDGPDVLRETLLIVAETMGFDRASLIAHIEGSDHAYVIAATDDPELSRFTLAVSDYPEVGAALRSSQPVLIDDGQSDPLTASAARAIRAKGIRGMAVFPVAWRGRPLGAVLMRRSAPGVPRDPRLIEFGRMFAGHAAAHLRHGRVMESLREQTHRISRARYEAERRLRTIDSLKEHFEAAADGVAILDEEGRILFVNRTAEGITGFARDGLIGSPLVDLVPDEQREPLAEVVRSVLSGHNIEAFDLDLSTTSGEPICVSVTTSTVLSRSGAVILSFRDVTEQRALEVELRKTKEFLERLIDSTVDAIIAADMRGNVILFNQGAERIYGYQATEVIGAMPVWQLYPDGVPRQIMRMLRSTSYGGVGRLEQTRREVLSASGELVPVNMTASIIYEDDREVATVGIFSDLRERIRIEERLLQAQEQLQMTEKQVLVAELAGAAAHELNQPLTSIMGYTQLIQRQSEPDAQHLRAVEIIFREAERMAEIVKKIGRITKYETMEYVGSASILDIDRSTQSTPDLVIPPEISESPAAEEPEPAGDLDEASLGAYVEIGMDDEETTIEHLDLGEVLGDDDDGGPTRHGRRAPRAVEQQPAPASAEVGADSADAGDDHEAKEEAANRYR